MKSLQFIITAFFSLLLMTSCSKDKDQVNIPASQVAGVYEGKFGTGSNNPSSFYSFNLQADGIIQEINSNGNVIGTGAWSLDGNVFHASYHYTFPATSFFKVVGTYDAGSKKIAGTWGYGDSETDGGKWSMTKK